jgi:hypothetical protein
MASKSDYSFSVQPLALMTSHQMILAKGDGKLILVDKQEKNID